MNLEGQSEASHSSDNTNLEQTTNTSQSEVVGSETGVEGGSHTAEDTAVKEFDDELDAMWELEPQEKKEELPDEAEEPPTEEDEQVEESEEVPDETVEETEEVVEETNEVEKVALNFMGQKVEVTADEMKDLAEKGMNVERLKLQYDKLKPLESLVEPLEVMANFYGISFDEMVRFTGSMNGVKESEIQRLISEGNTEEAAQQLLEAKLEAAKTKSENEKMKSKQTVGLSEIQKEQIIDFRRLRPDIDKKIQEGMELPVDVLRNWKNGVPLTESWLLHENEEASQATDALQKELKTLKKERDQLKKDIATIQKNAANKAKAPTSKKGTGGGAGHDDPFSGWDRF